MRRSKLLGLAFMVVLALTSIAATAASAEELPTILPLGSKAEAVTSTNTSGESVFGTGLLSVKSPESSGEASETEAQNGTYHVDFKGTELLGTKCQSLEDTTKPGIVLSLGSTHLRDAKEGTKLITVVAFLVENTHFSCGETLILTLGCVAGKLLPETGKLVSETKVDLETEGKDNKIIKISNATLTAEENCQLLASINGAGFALSEQKQTVTNKGFKKGTKATEVLIMAD
jgi:hypothetical protein